MTKKYILELFIILIASVLLLNDFKMPEFFTQGNDEDDEVIIPSQNNDSTFTLSGLTQLNGVTSSLTTGTSLPMNVSRVQEESNALSETNKNASPPENAELNTPTQQNKPKSQSSESPSQAHNETTSLVKLETQPITQSKPNSTTAKSQCPSGLIYQATGECIPESESSKQIVRILKPQCPSGMIYQTSGECVPSNNNIMMQHSENSRCCKTVCGKCDEQKASI